MACLLCCALACVKGWSQGQVGFRTPGSDTMKLVVIRNANSYRYEQKDTLELTYLVGDVKIKQENTLIDCDSMILNPKQNYIESFGHVHINDNDSTNIYSDYMKYLVDKRIVYFQKKVKLTDGKGILTTEELQYDLATKIGVYNHGGKVVNNGSVLTSDEGIYYEETKDVHFSKNVVLRDPQYDLITDSLLYNTEKQISTFITETNIVFKDSTHRTVRTRSGYYDVKNRKAEFGEYPVITDGSQNLTGREVHIDDSTGVYTAQGNAVYKDTTQGVTLYSDYMISNKKTNTFLATKTPVMMPVMAIKQEKDSIYLTGDTLFSERLIDAMVDERRTFVADSLHRIYVDSLEKSAADSMHLRALRNRQSQDTLAAGADSSMHIVDRSDSLSPGTEARLDKKELDSLHQREEITARSPKTTDTTVVPAKDTSLLHKAVAATDSTKHTDSTKLKPLSARQLQLQAQAQTDSLKRAQRKEKRLLAEKIQAQKDSTKKAAAEFKHKQRAAYDSLRVVAYHEKVRARERADSLREANYLDSIVGLAKGNIRQQLHLSDSLRKLGWSNQLILQKGLPLPIDSAALRRAFADSIRKAREKFIDDSIAAIPIDTSLRVIKAFHHVRIFSDSLQAVADSLYYSGRDSVFRLFRNPVAWGNGNYQVTGDTMFVFTKNKKPFRMYVFENALAINRVGRNFYNQMKGTTINCYFKNGDVDYMRAKGNAESIYYVQDEQKAYSGVNHGHADIIDMIFAPKKDGKGRELNKVVLRSDAEGSFIPIRKANFDELRLRGFHWREDLRPKSKDELFHPVAAPANTQL